MLALVLVVLAIQLRGVVGAVWLGVEVDLVLGLRALLKVLTSALTLPLAFLLLSALVLYAASGRDRDLGRAFDLACVAVLPVLVLQLVVTVIVRALDASVPGFASTVVWGASFAWAGALVALALRPARQRAVTVPMPPAPIVRRARLAGIAVMLVCAAGAALQAVWIARHLDEVKPMTHGEPAPTFALPAIGAGGALGVPVVLQSQRGKVVVLDFWATWCQPCLRAMPKLEKLARTHHDVHVMAINLDDAEEARRLWDEGHYTMTLLADDGHVSSRYGVTSIPHTVVIDRAGVVRHVARGTLKDLDATIDALLAEETTN